MNWKISKSNIHGVGVIVIRDIEFNEYIDTAILSDKTITFFGSKINHSWTPNTRLIYDPVHKVYDIYAKTPLKAGTEITVDYTFTPYFINKPLKFWK